MSTYKSLAALLALPPSTDTTAVMVLGFDAPGDGGQALWRRVPAAISGLSRKDVHDRHWATLPDHDGFYPAAAFGVLGDGHFATGKVLSDLLDANVSVRLGPGFFPVDRTLHLRVQDQKLAGAGGRSTILLVERHVVAPAVDAIIELRSVRNEVRDLAICFDQEGTTSRADMPDYPPAIFWSRATRCVVSGVFIMGAKHGIVARREPNRSIGGERIIDCSIGAVTNALLVDGALDTTMIQNVRCWPFAHNNQSVFHAIYMDGANEGVVIARADGFIMGDCGVFNAPLQFVNRGNGGPLGVVSGCIFDGDDGTIVMADGRIDMTAIYRTGNEADDRFLLMTGGQLGIASFHGTLRSNLPWIDVSGGDLTMTGGWLHLPPVTGTQIVRVSGTGTVILNAIQFAGSAGTAYTRPLVERVGHGRLTMTACRQEGPATGVFVRSRTDARNLVSSCLADRMDFDIV